MRNAKNVKWVIPFKKFGRVRVNIYLLGGKKTDKTTTKQQEEVCNK